MPHISSKIVQEKILKELEKNLNALVTNPSSVVRRRLFIELLTHTERKMLAKRLGVIALLSQGESSRKVSSLLGVSLSTTERFGHAIESGRYKTIVNWFPRERAIEKFFSFIGTLTALAFAGKRESFGKVLDEM